MRASFLSSKQKESEKNSSHWRFSLQSTFKPSWNGNHVEVVICVQFADGSDSAISDILLLNFDG